jgi:hypothetical protein
MGIRSPIRTLLIHSGWLAVVGGAYYGRGVVTLLRAGDRGGWIDERATGEGVQRVLARFDSHCAAML